MEIRDSRGRKVSLLNDELPRLSNLASTKGQTLPPLHHRPASYFSGGHTSSSASSNAGGSPPSVTPSLSRSDSSDSAAFHSPSPPTPLSSGLEHLRQALPKRNKSQIDGLPGIASLSRRSSTFSSSSHQASHYPHHPPSSTASSSSSSTSTSASTSGPLPRHAASAAARSSMDFSSQPPLGGVSDFAFPPTSTLVASPQSAFDPLVLGGSASSPISTSALSAQQPLPNPSAFDATAAAAAVVPQSPFLPQQPQNQQQQQPQNGTNGVYPAPVTQSRSQKKNSYPCPLSKQYNCPEFFTTSGHAARHAKKHTGKKDAICPECGKGFTRKDNMEQHRRTHANGRNAHNTHQNSVSSSSSNNTSAGSSSSSSSGSKSAPKVTDADESKARKKAQQQRKARPSSISTSAPMPIQATGPSLSQPSTATSAVPPTIDLLDPALRGQAAFGFSPSSADFGMYPFDPVGINLDTAGASQQFQAPHAPMRSSHSSQGNSARMRQESGSRDSMSMARPRPGPTSPSLAPKLDALALVAEGVRRRDSDGSP